MRNPVLFSSRMVLIPISSQYDCLSAGSYRMDWTMRSPGLALDGEFNDEAVFAPERSAGASTAVSEDASSAG